jgi:hypothetical protein
MKFSPASLLLLIPLATSVVATGATAVAAEPSFDLEGGPVQHWRDIHSRLRIGFRGMRKRPNAKDLAFLVQAIKRSYNIIHAPQEDDFSFVDFNVTSVEMQPEVSLVESSSTSLLEWLTGSDVAAVEGKNRKKKRRGSSRRRWSVSAYGISDVACNLCGKDDDALALGGPPPFANLKPIEELLCKILTQEGPNDVFGDITTACTIFQIEPLGSWAFEKNENTSDEHEDATTKTHATAPDHDVVSGGGDEDSSKLSIALAGLSCDEKQDFLSCQDDGLHQLVSDALVIAYNQVNFGDDYFIQDFVPTSLELYRGESDPAAFAATTLRGTQGTKSLLTGTWYGSVRVQCRACACDEEIEEGADPVLAPFLNLKQVEAVFCGLLSDAGDESDALTSLAECSLSVVEMVEPEDDDFEFAPSSFLLESNN